MITTIPVEIQQLVLTHLPIHKKLAEAVWIPEDMVIVMRHMQAAADRKEVKLEDWMHMPPFYRAALLSCRPFIVPPVSLNKSFGFTTQRIGEQRLNQDPSMNAFIWAAVHGATDAARLLLRWCPDERALMGISPAILNANLAFDPAAGYNTPLFGACASGNREMAKLLLQDPRVDPNAPIMERVGRGTPRLNRHFRAAAAKGHEGVVQLLLSDQRRNGEESEALIDASHHGHLNMIDLLLKDGRASASWVDSECLREACAAGHLAVQLLATTDADINACEVGTCWSLPSTDLPSPLREARNNGRTDVVEYLLKDPRLDLNSVTNSDE